MPVETVVIDRRFCGPPESGQGGYTCGLLARVLPGAVEVSLRAPPPLERPLIIENVAGDQLELSDGDTVIAQARAADLDLAPPARVTLDEAKAAVAGYLGFKHHAFPSCFACGPDRDEGDGLRLFPGPVEGREIVSCPWQPSVELADAGGLVRPGCFRSEAQVFGGALRTAALPARASISASAISSLPDIVQGEHVVADRPAAECWI